MTSLETWLAQVKERLEKATPGPWKQGAEPNYPMPEILKNLVRYPSNESPGTKSSCSDFFQVRDMNDALLIAAAPTDLKKAVMIIEAVITAVNSDLTYSGPELIRTGGRLNKIAALSDEEVWK